MAEPTISELEKRLSRLERYNRWLKWMVALMAIVWIAGLPTFGILTKVGRQPVMKQIIETEQLVIKDPTGKVRLLLGRDETSGSPESQYGLFIYGKDGESQSELTSWNLNIYSGDGSADFSPISISATRYKGKVSQYLKELSRLSEKRKKQNLTKQEEEAERVRLGREHEPVARFYVNMAGPYLEVTKKSDGQAYSGAGGVQVGVSPYPSVRLSSAEDKTSFSLSALKDGAGLTIRDGQGNKRASLDVDSSAGVGMNLYDKDGKTVRATFGNVTLQTIRTGGIQQRPVSSLVLFDKDGKTYWSTP